MKIVEGIITAVSPLHLGDGQSRGTFLSTLSYIPGRTIRGMLGYYLYHHNKDLFSRSGIDEEDDPHKMKVFFRNAYPVTKDGMRTVAAPLSVRWCKKCGSIIPAGKTECGVIDDCGKPCLHEGKKHSGLISLHSFETRKLERPVMPDRSIETKCPITRDSHSSPGGRDEGFELSPYNIESVDPGAKFSFRMVVDEALEKEIVTSLIKAAATGGIGGFRSRGYGLVTFGNIRSIPLESELQNRESQMSESSPATLVVTSPMILRNVNLSRIGFDDVFVSRVNETLQFCGVPDTVSQLDIAEPHISGTIARGWSLKYNNSLGELIPCIGMGSSVKIRASCRALAALEVFGIGEKMNYGYGEVYVLPWGR